MDTSKLTTTKIPHPDVNRHTRAPLIAARQIIAQPRDISRERRIDATNPNKNSRIDQARQAAARGGDGDDEADEDHAHGEKDEGGATHAGGVAVGEPGGDDGEDGGGDVDGDGEELGGAGGVAEFFDDGGEEEGCSGDGGISGCLSGV